MRYKTFLQSISGIVKGEAFMSAVLRRVANIRFHWIIVCDATLDPTEFARGDWVEESRALRVVLRAQVLLCGQRID